MLDAIKSLRDEMLALKNRLDVDKTCDPTQTKSLPGPSTRTSDPVHSDPSEVQPMDLEPYGPSLPPRSTQKPQPERGVHSDLHSNTRIKLPILNTTRPDQNIKNMLTGRNTSQNPSIKNLARLQRKMSPLLTLEGLLNLSKKFLQNLTLRPAQTQSSIGR